MVDSLYPIAQGTRYALTPNTSPVGPTSDWRTSWLEWSLCVCAGWRRVKGKLMCTLITWNASLCRKESYNKGLHVERNKSDSLNDLKIFFIRVIPKMWLKVFESNLYPKSCSQYYCLCFSYISKTILSHKKFKQTKRRINTFPTNCWRDIYI